MKRRDLLKSAILAIPGVGWLARRARAGIEPLAPKPLEFATFHGRVIYNRVDASWSAWDGEDWAVRTGLTSPPIASNRCHAGVNVLEVRFPTGSPIPPITEAGGWLYRFYMVWHEDEWWVPFTTYTGYQEARELLERYPEENKPFIQAIQAFINENYVIIDPFSKATHHRT